MSEKTTEGIEKKLTEEVIPTEPDEVGKVKIIIKNAINMKAIRVRKFEVM